jgi:hypothetical protein
LRIEGQHFQHLLWCVNKGKNFPSFQMLSACWVIGSICRHSAARRAPVPVKRSAINASSWLKTTLYYQWVMGKGGKVKLSVCLIT